MAEWDWPWSLGRRFWLGSRKGGRSYCPLGLSVGLSLEMGGGHWELLLGLSSIGDNRLLGWDGYELEVVCWWFCAGELGLGGFVSFGG